MKKDKKQVNAPIGLQENLKDGAPDETSFIPLDSLPKEEKEGYSFPWLGLIISGVLVVLIIVCVIIIFAFGGPLT